MSKLLIRETFINEDTNVMFGESGWYEPYETELGTLYRTLRSEYGRCISKVYRDRKGAPPVAVGWVFQKRDKYEDSKGTYLRSVWVEYRFENDEE
jgi:hypothetical protein